MRCFDRSKKDKYIHGTILFGTQGKKNKMWIRKSNRSIERMARKTQKVMHLQIREEPRLCQDM